MSENILIVVLVLLVLVLALLLWLLLRKNKVEFPPDWPLRLAALESASQSILLGGAKTDGALIGIERQFAAAGGRADLQANALRQSVDEKLVQSLAQVREGRSELAAGFAAFEAKIEQRFEGLQLAVSARLDDNGQALRAYVLHAQTDAAQARKELSESLVSFRAGLTQTLSQLAAETVQSRDAMTQASKLNEASIQQRFEVLTQATRLTLESLKVDINAQLATVAQALRDQLEANGYQIKNQFAVLQDAVTGQLGGLVQGSQQNADQLRAALNERLLAIQTDNTAKLEEMRRTVDEKLHATLEQRLGESFKLVSERLEQVHAGLGEMKTLAGSVGDLKRVMTNVKSRGTWGEMQLGAIIENVMTTEQFSKNVKTNPASNDMVEFAIRLPGKSGDQPLWIPIDSKYPQEYYQRLLDAYDSADKDEIKAAGNAFETSIKSEAKKISAKYVAPPHTTDFAILYLPTEGLFAEVIRRPGLQEALQNDCRVMITGPSNLTAMLNILQMGFKTLAIEKRSSEVWTLLSAVKTEFGKFGQIVDETKKSIDAAAKKFELVGTRTRAIERKLRDVQEIEAPPVTAQPLLEAIGLADDVAD